MRTKVPFYFGTTRNLVIAFGGLFGDIYLRNRDTDGVSQKIVKCPIAYINKEKFMARLTQDPDMHVDTLITLPRMSFEIVGFAHDRSRQMNKMSKTIASTNTDGARTVYYYSPVPYNLSFNLYSYTRTNEDNYQIMEQILPFFTPDMNLSVKMMTDPEIIQDMPLILDSVNTEDSSVGAFENTRHIITEYRFTMKAYYYSPLMGSADSEKHFEDGPSTQLIKHTQITINGQVKYSAIVNPFEANKDDLYDIDESITLL